jgi:hypothetical protein
MASSFTAVYDACVLYPAPLRDLLLRLGATGLFRARWTVEINDEWSRNLSRSRADIPKPRIDALVALVNDSVPDCLITGYEELIGGLQLPDPGDRHVLAAAIRAGAGVIVTYNIKDFPEPELAKYGIEVQHPDTFVGHLLDLAPAVVAAVVKDQRAVLRNPPRNAEELLATLEQQQLVGTVARLREMIALI